MGEGNGNSDVHWRGHFSPMSRPLIVSWRQRHELKIWNRQFYSIPSFLTAPNYFYKKKNNNIFKQNRLRWFKVDKKVNLKIDLNWSFKEIEIFNRISSCHFTPWGLSSDQRQACLIQTHGPPPKLQALKTNQSSVQEKKRAETVSVNSLLGPDSVPFQFLTAGQ